ncbi:MAG: rhodanese-like domain-containing protein [Verrucomicrobia bacterium]|nr:rhodanese-like domain-containing protein [Verrucomicrobiota bacterium]
MGRLQEIYPGARRALFKRYHIGGCSSCGFLPDETLAAVLARHQNPPLAEVLAHLVASQEQDVAMEMDPPEAASRMKQGEKVRLLDIRTREEWEATRIPGAEFVNQALVQSLMGAEGRQGLLVFYDHLGKSSLDAAAYFWGHGHENARSLRGGIDAWALQVDPSIPRYRLEASS